MRMKVTVVMLVCILFLLSGCNSTGINAGLLELDFKAQYIRTNGYVEGIKYPIVTIIKSTDELERYYLDKKDTYDLERRTEIYSDTTTGFLNAIDKYDNAYFKDSILILILLEEGSGSIRHTVKGAKDKQGLVEIAIERITPEIGTDDMAEWHIMIELKKADYKASDINVQISDSNNTAIEDLNTLTLDIVKKLALDFLNPLLI